MTFEEYFKDWSTVIPKKELQVCLNTINKLYKSTPCTPDYNSIFRAFTMTSRRDCNVVILAQDPYPQKGVATGLAFGNNEDGSTSPSLEVLMEASGIEDKTLESIAKQGVLLLNSSLTCKVNEPTSHSLIWRPFISKFLKNMSEIETGIIYILMGETAKSFEPYIGKYNHILKCSHPAYYARTKTKMPNTVFIKTNQILKDIYGREKQIQWGSRD